MSARTEVVEIPNPKPSSANRHSVPVDQWVKWGKIARRVFNEVYASMNDQSVVKHPEGPFLYSEHWKTIRWNASWLAASAAERSGG